MCPSFLRSVIAGSVLLASTLSVGLSLGERAQPVPAASWATADTDLFEEMMGIRSSLRPLAQQLNDPTKDEESLKLIWAMQGHLINARQADPPTIEDLPSDQHAAHRRAYRTALAETIREMINLELDLLAGDRDAASKRIQEGLLTLRNAAHEKFQVSD